jgi:hypothetical protein
MKHMQSTQIEWKGEKLVDDFESQSGGYFRNPSQATLYFHEYLSIKFLVEQAGFKITWLQQSGIKRCPDFMMDGVEWELKTIRGSGKATVANAINSGLRQSKNIIIDTRFSNMSEKNMYREINDRIRRRTINNLYIVWNECLKKIV